MRVGYIRKNIKNIMKINIGNKDLLEKIPQKIEIKNRPYILNKNKNNEFVIYDAICPHFNGVVNEINGKTWRCSNHGWTFDSLTGDNLNSGKHLHSYKIEICNNDLFVNLPMKLDNKSEKIRKKEKIIPKITLVNNACLLLEWNGFRLLTDPWIEGSIFHGSFTNYPPNQIKASNLPKIDAIWISHEHSDHLNEYSLSFFDKNIPIYVPDYDGKRLESILKKIGFKNITSLGNGETKFLSDEIKITSYFSGSVWNDSIQFIQLGNFKILNLNDAGFNWKIKDVHDEVDLVCTQFTGPGSSFPLTWTHLSKNQKRGIITKTNEGFLQWLKQIVDITKTKYLLPFANYNEIYHPDLLHYLDNKPQNTINDVRSVFKGTDTYVLDLLPGESWSEEFLRIPDREKYFDNAFKMKYLKQKFIDDDKLEEKSKKHDINDNEIILYFEKFSNSFLSLQVGTYTIKLIIKNMDSNREFYIIFENGNVSVRKSDSSIKNPNMVWECPEFIVQRTIHNDLSWDEAQLGYWCRFSRSPDVYNVALWKILHSPWRARQSISRDLITPVSKISIADLIEQNGKKVSDVLERHGLFCVGCSSAVGENISDACEIHGFSDSKKNNLIEELEVELNQKLN